jgi:hypothetical protein
VRKAHESYLCRRLADEKERTNETIPVKENEYTHGYSEAPEICIHECSN